MTETFIEKKLANLNKQLDDMTDRYQEWTDEHELPSLSADELLLELHDQKRFLNSQINYVNQFIKDWDGLVRAIERTQAEIRKDQEFEAAWYKKLQQRMGIEE